MAGGNACTGWNCAQSGALVAKELFGCQRNGRLGGSCGGFPMAIALETEEYNLFLVGVGDTKPAKTRNVGGLPEWLMSLCPTHLERAR